jgi:S-formylglutathione hydrolase FrmB
VTSVGVVAVSWGEAAEHLRHWCADVSLMHGWLPLMMQVAAVAALVGAIGLRSRRWWLRSMPVAVALGVLVAAALHWYLDWAAWTNEPTPPALWAWLGASGLAAGVVVVGWRATRWWRRGSAVAGTGLCLLSAALVLNAWVGYSPTVYAAWNLVMAGPLPDQSDPAGVAAMARSGVIPTRGVVVPVTIGEQASGFRHRGELVYLPPAWFASTPPPPLPVIEMVGAEINTPADWVRAGDAAATADAFAAAHGGYAPVLVFVDSGGSFGVDTECVNGTRGNAADHLTLDVIPFIVSRFGTASDAAHWGVAGFSTGGTCALDLTVMHPDLFSAFLDIAGDAGPNAGTKAQTIARLFGGDAAAWASFDPATVITAHSPYRGISGWFAVAPSSDRAANTAGQDIVANALCRLGLTRGIDCAVLAQPGRHDWLFAARAFTAALPWLAGQLDTAHVERTAFPAPPPAPGPAASPRSTVEAAPK